MKFRKNSGPSSKGSGVCRQFHYEPRMAETPPSAIVPPATLPRPRAPQPVARVPISNQNMLIRAAGMRLYRAKQMLTASRQS